MNTTPSHLQPLNLWLIQPDSVEVTTENEKLSERDIFLQEHLNENLSKEEIDNLHFQLEAKKYEFDSTSISEKSLTEIEEIFKNLILKWDFDSIFVLYFYIKTKFDKIDISVKDIYEAEKGTKQNIYELTLLWFDIAFSSASAEINEQNTREPLKERQDLRLLILKIKDTLKSINNFELDNFTFEEDTKSKTGELETWNNFLKSVLDNNLAESEREQKIYNLVKIKNDLDKKWFRKLNSKNSERILAEIPDDLENYDQILVISFILWYKLDCIRDCIDNMHSCSEKTINAFCTLSEMWFYIDMDKVLKTSSISNLESLSGEINKVKILYAKTEERLKVLKKIKLIQDLNS